MVVCFKLCETDDAADCGQLCASLSDSGHIPGRLSPTVCCTFSSGHSTPHMGPGKKYKMPGYQLQDEQDYVVKVIFSFH